VLEARKDLSLCYPAFIPAFFSLTTSTIRVVDGLLLADRTGPPKWNPSLFVILKYDYVVIPAGKHVHHVVPEEFMEPNYVVVVGKCNKCGSCALLFGEDVELYDVNHRQMGSERYYVADCGGHCGICDVDLEVEAYYSVYAYEWDNFVNYNRNCELAEVFGLKELIRDIPGQEPEETDDTFEEWAQRPTGFTILVKGQDDQYVMTEFLRKILGKDPSEADLHIFTGPGGGGKEKVVQSARWVADISEKAGIPIRFLIVLDGDASQWASQLSDDIRKRLFLLPRKEIESYLFDSKAISIQLNTPEHQVRKLIDSQTNHGKEGFEHVISHLGVRPTSQIKQLLARQMEKAPDDFVALFKIIETSRERQ
jgi:hypothetical protein